MDDDQGSVENWMRVEEKGRKGGDEGDSGVCGGVTG